MAQHLPPLNALRTFEAVARLKSFTKAADELFVTRAAVSHQIKNLEEYLGFPLIERNTRSISLTPAAEVALPKLREGFNNLSDAVHQMKLNLAHGSINVWMTPSFASKWLVPRLHDFTKKHPEIDMQITGNARLIDSSGKTSLSMEELFRNNEVDVAIRFSSGSYPGYKVNKLFSVRAIPLCSPELLNDPDKPLNSPEDLQFHTLLHDNTNYKSRPEWSKWLKEAGVDSVNIDRGPRFNHISLAMDAAIDGQGVMLGFEDLARNDMKAGRLCAPFDFSIPLKRSYYIIQPESGSSNQHAVDSFVDWLMEEAASED